MPSTSNGSRGISCFAIASPARGDQVVFLGTMDRFRLSRRPLSGTKSDTYGCARSPSKRFRLTC